MVVVVKYRHRAIVLLQLTIFSIQLDCVLIIKPILVKSTVNPTREILKLEM